MLNIDQFEIGDLLEIARKGYSHWGVYAGDGYIIHLTSIDSPCGGIIDIFKRILSKTVVKREKLYDVLKKSKVIANNLLDRKLKAKLKEETFNFAEECLGKEGYSVLFGNCETFANMCRYGNPVSFQAVNIMKILFALNAGIAVGKITKSFLEDKIGCFGATVDDEIAGVVTTCVTLCLSITVSLVEELMISLVREASKQVLLTAGWWAAASNIGLILNILYIVYEVVRSEIFRTICSWLWESFSDFLSGLYDLVARTVYSLRSESQ